LLSAAAVRASAQRMLALAQGNALADWRIDMDRLPATADFVARVVKDRYPKLNPPVHARWRHFVFGGRDLWQEIVAKTTWPNPAAAARAAFDLVLTSVLLDAGAGPDWSYFDAATGIRAARSEGLALASLRWFASGGLSDEPGDPLRVDAKVLRRLDAASIRAAFQVSETNPLLGVEGRADLLNRLGGAVESQPEFFGLADSPRPGGLFDALTRRAGEGASRAQSRSGPHSGLEPHSELGSQSQLPAADILAVLLEALGSIWQNRPTLGGVPLGDCWLHPAFGTGVGVETGGWVGGTGAAAGASFWAASGYVPLHKLSQWLTYSLIEPLVSAGIAVCRIEELTGLAEYRNGGLFVDGGVLVPRDDAAAMRSYEVSDPFVVGWRSLTVALLDRIAPMVGSRLGLSAAQFPLANVLEGGTWAAGRLIARDKRPDGGPPFQISSDGTVF
jgi:hypothetical protein